MQRGVGVLLRVHDPHEQVDQPHQPVHLGAVRRLDGVEVRQVEQDEPGWRRRRAAWRACTSSQSSSAGSTPSPTAAVVAAVVGRRTPVRDSSRPARTLKSVDLPAPVGPASATTVASRPCPIRSPARRTTASAGSTAVGIEAPVAPARLPRRAPPGGGRACRSPRRPDRRRSRPAAARARPASGGRRVEQRVEARGLGLEQRAGALAAASSRACSASVRTAWSPSSASRIRWPAADVPPATSDLGAGQTARLREDGEHHDEAGAVDAERCQARRRPLPAGLAAARGRRRRPARRAPRRACAPAGRARRRRAGVPRCEQRAPGGAVRAKRPRRARPPGRRRRGRPRRRSTAPPRWRLGLGRRGARERATGHGRAAGPGATPAPRIRSPVPTTSCQRASTSPRSSAPLWTASSTSSSAAAYAPSTAARSSRRHGRLLGQRTVHPLDASRQAVQRAGQRAAARAPARPCASAASASSQSRTGASAGGGQAAVLQRGLGDHEQLRRRPGRARATISRRWPATSRTPSGGTRSRTSDSAVPRSRAACSSSHGHRVGIARGRRDEQPGVRGGEQLARRARGWPRPRSRCRASPAARARRAAPASAPARARPGPAGRAGGAAHAGQDAIVLEPAQVVGMADEHGRTGRRPQHAGRADRRADKAVDERRLPGPRGAAHDHQQRRVHAAQPRQQVVVDLCDELVADAARVLRAGHLERQSDLAQRTAQGEQRLGQRDARLDIHIAGVPVRRPRESRA